MSAQTERLERVAAEERERLGEHLDQLQKKLERALDPAVLFDRHPLPILATALVGGVILGAVTKSDGSPRRRAHDDDETGRFRGGSHRGGFLQDGMIQLRGALVGMLFAKIAEKVQDLASGADDPPVRRTPKRSPARPVDAAEGAGKPVA